MIMSNIVSKKNLRKVQLDTLDLLAEALSYSFGPSGSNTEIIKDNALNMYTKDGHTILKNIICKGAIENGVKSDIEDITRHVAKTVGDGTTSAVLLSRFIFMELCNLDNKLAPSAIVNKFREAVDKIKKSIKEHASDTTLDDIYKIAFISSNGDQKIANNIYNIYEQHGMEVFIDTSASTGKEDLLKIYDGMTLDSGYCDSVFINDPSKNSASLRNPNIYIFEDPVDTVEMVGFLDKIILDNIFVPAAKEKEMIPTVIVTPKFSRDMSSFFDKLTEFMAGYKNNYSKPPLVIITNVTSKDTLMDIAKMCDCPLIKKYIDPNIQMQDIESGKAPTPETICNFCGKADLVEADANKTKFINPVKMFNEDGTYSDTFNGLLNFLNAELERGYAEGEDAGFTGALKKRINALKGNLVEYLVGGVSVSDRDSALHLVEDAVLNCRSAALNGTGYGANYEGLKASHDLYEQNPDDVMIKIVYMAYKDLFEELYKTVEVAVSEGFSDRAEEALHFDNPMNLRTEKYDGTVKSSIESDVVILDAISKIVTIMFTCNQCILQNPLYNTYYSEDEITE